ncbi:MAG TPA: hypothetical protein V6D20_20675, partial [Candidatus Obscuribacterales bacterium]
QLSLKLQAEGVAVMEGHWRPSIKRGPKERQSNVEDPHGQTPRGSVSSFLKLGWLWLNWWVGWWKSIRKARKRGVVIYDRYHVDLLVDPKRYRYGAAMGLARLASRFMPQPDAVFYLDAPPDILLSRKQELPLETLERFRERYLDLSKATPNFVIIDATKPLAEVISEVDSKLRGLISQIHTRQ